MKIVGMMDESAPVAAPTGPQKRLHVERAYFVDAVLVVVGWSADRLQLGLHAGNGRLACQVLPIARPDVSAHLGLDPDDRDLGFALFATCEDRHQPTLTWKSHVDGTAGTMPLKAEVRPSMLPHDSNLFNVVRLKFATALAGQGPGLARLVKSMPVSAAPCPTARAHIEAAVALERSGDGVVVGWTLHEPGTTVWLEDELGNAHSLAGAFRTHRKDVVAALGAEFHNPAGRAGFALRLAGVEPGGKLRLRAVSKLGVHTIAEATIGRLPAEPVGVARWLASIDAPVTELQERIALIDEPLLRRLINERRDAWSALPVDSFTVGTPCARPQASIIVPLYGRADFVEHQLLEFARDRWLLDHCEILYVIDDPDLVHPFRLASTSLHQIHRVPFRCLFGQVNRGFSGANNLGASVATGEHLIFLNSDAFPIQPGWAAALVEVLRTQPRIGAVGPRLLAADGSIQHAGMSFQRRDDLGLWFNHHPCMGLDPALDPHRELTPMPAITGACLAMRRRDFDRIEGWDTGYLIGDFEDSDLCFKLREAGLGVAYLPTVELVHLERQSFRLLGGGFRDRVVYFNAVRHQRRWGAQLEQFGAAAPDRALRVSA